MRLIDLEGRDVVLVNVEGRFYALDNRCPHQGAPLSGGTLEGGAVVCPRHQWRWDPKNGRALWPDIDWRAFCYPVKVEDGHILVRVA